MYPERWWDDAYVERRLAAARAPGAWQVVAAEGLKPPWSADAPSPLASDEYVEYERIERPVLLVAGAADKLRRLDALHDRAARIPNCTTYVFERGGHAPHIQFPDEFNAVVLDFLGG
jgi:pimeloyl-ACP methyl ester carboxylesterase